MASDEDYMAFLDKANQDVSGGGQATTQSGGGRHVFKTTDQGSEVPKPIQTAVKSAVYVTDADEPFEGVSLKFSGNDGLPDEGTNPFHLPFLLILHQSTKTLLLTRLDPLQSNSRSSSTTGILTARTSRSWTRQTGTRRVSTARSYRR